MRGLWVIKLVAMKSISLLQADTFPIHQLLAKCTPFQERSRNQASRPFLL
jgi:hypothetical protein